MDHANTHPAVFVALSLVQPVAAAFVARLLGVPADALENALTHRIVHSGRGSMYQVVLTAQQCADARDALAKAVYARFFDWLVAGLNQRMASIETDAPPSHARASASTSC